MFLSANDEKVASSKHIPNPRLESKNHTLFKTNTAGKPIPFGATRTCFCTYYSPYKVVPLLGFQFNCLSMGQINVVVIVAVVDVVVVVVVNVVYM